MTILLDTNVILDVALQREPWRADSECALRSCRMGHTSLLAWHTISTLFYVLRRNQVSDKDARQFCRDLVAWTTLAQTSQDDLLRAFDLPMADFEDALQSATALAVSANYILSRNTKDFAASPVPAISPSEFLRLTSP